MGDEPGGFVTRAEHCELDALRCRAYGPAADIFDDAAAVSRLQELEDRVRVELSPDEPSHPTLVDAPGEHAPVARWHRTLVISAAAMAVLLGGYAWTEGGSPIMLAVTSAQAAEGVLLRSLGTMYGREVGAGPTVDGEYCMIVAETPEPSVTCVRLEDVSASSKSVILPTWHRDPDTGAVIGLGQPVRYSLLPNGSVSAEPVGHGPPKS